MPAIGQCTCGGTIVEVGPNGELTCDSCGCNYQFHDPELEKQYRKVEQEDPRDPSKPAR